MNCDFIKRIKGKGIQVLYSDVLWPSPPLVRY